VRTARHVGRRHHGVARPCGDHVTHRKGWPPASRDLGVSIARRGVREPVPQSAAQPSPRLRHDPCAHTLGADRTRIRCSWSFSPEDLERPGFDPSYAVDFWDLTNRQDWSACESVQRGLASEHWVPGQLAPDEDGVYQFVTMVARAYQGLPLAAGTVPVS